MLMQENNNQSVNFVWYEIIQMFAVGKQKFHQYWKNVSIRLMDFQDLSNQQSMHHVSRFLDQMFSNVEFIADPDINQLYQE